MQRMLLAPMRRRAVFFLGVLLLLPGCRRGEGPDRESGGISSPQSMVVQPDEPRPNLRHAAWAYLQEGFDVDDPAARRMAGNFQALTEAYRLAGFWHPSPPTVEAFVQTPQFQAINLWDPYADAPGLLEEGRPPGDAPPGTYWSWVEGEERLFAAVTVSTTLVIRRTIDLEPSAWEDPSAVPLMETPPPPNLSELLTYCRALWWIGWYATSHHHYPELAEQGTPPPADLEDLKARWWLWDAEAMLAVSPLPLEDLAFFHFGRGSRLSLIPACLVGGEPVWMWGGVGERAITGPLAKDHLGLP